MAIQYLCENGFEIRIEKGEITATRNYQKEKYRLLFDAGYHRLDEEWGKLFIRLGKEIKDVKEKEMIPMIAVGETLNAGILSKRFPECSIISLGDYDFKFRQNKRKN